MTQPFLALITPISAGGDGQPSHPWVPPSQQPPGYWGGVAPPSPDHGLAAAPGGASPGYWGGVSPPYPTHPIAPGGRPPGIWGPNDPRPTPPIYFPPPGGPPPLGIWGGRPPAYVDIGGPGPQPKPEHPIVLPPGLPPSVPEGPIDW